MSVCFSKQIIFTPVFWIWILRALLLGLLEVGCKTYTQRTALSAPQHITFRKVSSLTLGELPLDYLSSYANDNVQVIRLVTWLEKLANFEFQAKRNWRLPRSYKWFVDWYSYRGR